MKERSATDMTTCLRLSVLWLLMSRSSWAQSGCSGSTSSYSTDGYTFPFTNLCGKDITAQVDFLDPTNENTWQDCLSRCVRKAPLCYGLDLTPLGTAAYNCWLMNATFPESSAKSQTYTVDAAMVDQRLVAGLPSDCSSLDLLGCASKYGQLPVISSTASVRVASSTFSSLSSTHSVISAVTSSSTIATDTGGVTTTFVTTVVGTTGPSTATSTNVSTSSTGELSIGAKAGIDFGVSVIIILVVTGLGFCLVERKMRNRSNDIVIAEPTATYQNLGFNPHPRDPAELQADTNRYQRTELHGKTAFVAEKEAPLPVSELSVDQMYQRHELKGSSRFGS